MLPDFASMNGVLLDVLGEDVVLHVSGTDIPVLAEFRAAYQGNNIDGLPIEIQGPRLLLDAETAAASGVAIGDTATVRGTGYTITELDTDEADMTRLLLARYTP